MDRVGRVFVAAPLPPEARLALAEQTADLRIPGRLVPPANWHITLRFLDVVDRVTYERFLAAVEVAAGHPRFAIALDGLGAFPNARKATVFWAAVGRGAEELAGLNEIAEEAAQSAGLMPEERPFNPHLTLSRIRPPANVIDLVGEELDIGWRCDRLTVFLSHVGRGGARYEELDSIELPGKSPGRTHVRSKI